MSELCEKKKQEISYLMGCSDEVIGIVKLYNSNGVKLPPILREHLGRRHEEFIKEISRLEKEENNEHEN